MRREVRPRGCSAEATRCLATGGLSRARNGRTTRRCAAGICCTRIGSSRRMGEPLSNGRGVILGGVLGALGGLIAGAHWSASEQGPNGSADGQIRAVLADQAEAWNAGDLDRFMNGYSKAEGFTYYSGGNVTRGHLA